MRNFVSLRGFIRSFRRSQGDFAACGRRVSFPAMGKKPMAQATFSWPCGPIHLEDRRGTAQDGHFVSIFALPPVPPFTEVTPWVRQSISGAQNLSGWSKSLPAHWGLRRRGFRIPRFARLGKARSLHCSSSPTQTRCAGLCVGGRLRRPIWVENCGWCGFSLAPGFAEQVAVGP